MRNLLFLGLLLVGQLSWGQATLQQLLPQELFSEGVDMMAKSQYGAARQYFERYLNTTDSRYTEQAEYNLALCALSLYHLDGETLLTEFIKKYPASQKALLAHFELGNYFFRDKDFKKAIPHFEEVNMAVLTRLQKQERNYKLGYSYFALRKFKEAKPYFDKLKDTKGKYQLLSAYYAGFIAYELKNYEEAIADLETAANDPAFSTSVAVMLVSVYYQKGDFPALISYLEPKLSNPKLSKNPQLAIFLGDAYYFEKQYAQAVKQFARAGKKLSKTAAYHYGASLVALGQWQQAGEVLKTIADTDTPTGIASSYLLGQVYLKTNQKLYALGAFLQLQQVEPAEIAEESTFLAAQLAYQLARTTQAISLGNKYLTAYPQGKHANKVSELIANALVQSNDYEKAMAYIEQLSHLSSTHKQAYQKAAYRLGVTQFNDRNFRQAVASFTASLQYPMDATLAAKAHVYMAEAYSLGRRYAEAEPHYRKALLVPQLPASERQLAMFGLGYALYNQQQYAEAKTSFKNFISTNIADNPYFGRALLRLADCEYIAKNYDAALKHYTQVVQGVYREKDYATYQIGVIYHLQSKYTKAIEKFRYLLKLYNHSPYRDDAVFEIGAIYLETGDYPAANTAFTTLIADYPKSKYVPIALEKRALVAFNQKQYDQTIADYELFLQKYPYHPHVKDVLLGLQQAYSLAGRSSEFTVALQRFKNKNPDLQGLEEVEFDALLSYYNEGLYAKAAQGLKAFIANYPDHPKLPEARFILAESYFRQSNTKEALQVYKKIVANQLFDQMYRVYERIADVAYAQNNYATAKTNYHLLAATAISQNQQLRATAGLMKAHFYMASYDSALYYAENLLNRQEGGGQFTVEALLFKGKSLLAQGNFNQAKEVFEQTAQQANDVYGAEAQYLLGEILYMQNQFDASNEVLYIIPQKFGNYTEWLDKAFLLIVDNFIGKKEYFQARATLESIIENTTTPLTRTKAQERLADLTNLEAQEREEADTLQVVVKDSIPDE